MIPSICSTCLRSGVLCERCQEKLDTGEVTQLDLDVARLILELEKQNQNLKKVELMKTLSVGNIVVLQVSKKSVPVLLSAEPNPLEVIEKKLKKTVRVVPYSQASSRVVAGILAPVEVAGIDTIFVPDGTIEKKIRISKSDSDRLPASIEMVERLLHQITGERFRITVD